MSDMKCPFCQQELREIYCYGVAMGYLCPNPDCKPVFKGNKELWQELIRTRKVFDVAVDALKSAHGYYQNCVVREKQPHEINWYCTAMNMDNDIFNALEQITAPEQKKSAFVHNKIEFPEYNDNLLEEFDKQFFEKGQDDDLTETALEQKDVK